jgi:hypothetical protein
MNKFISFAGGVPMNVGDVVIYKDEKWKVCKISSKWEPISKTSFSFEMKVGLALEKLNDSQQTCIIFSEECELCLPAFQ